jgi:hypothetical protein
MFPEVAQLFIDARGELIFGGQLARPDILSASLPVFAVWSLMLH